MLIIGTAITQAKRIDLDADLVEPVVIAIVQDRMSTPEALSFAALLVEQSTLKVSRCITKAELTL